MPVQDDIWWLEGDDIFGADTGIEGIDDNELGSLMGNIKAGVGAVSGAHKRLGLPDPTSPLSPFGGGGGGGGGGLKGALALGRKAVAQDVKKKRPTGGTPLGYSKVMDRIRRQGVGRPAAGPQEDQSPVNLLIRALTAEKIADRVTKTPKVTMRKESNGASSGNRQFANLVANAVKNSLGGEIGNINKRLALAANQRTATSEHLSINDKTAFRKKVLGDLLRISANLPPSHPTRQRIRRVGLMSGLL